MVVVVVVAVVDVFDVVNVDAGVTGTGGIIEGRTNLWRLNQTTAGGWDDNNDDDNGDGDDDDDNNCHNNNKKNSQGAGGLTLPGKLRSCRLSRIPAGALEVSFFNTNYSLVNI